MTVAAPTRDVAVQMLDSIRSLRQAMPRAAFGMSAGALVDHDLAGWAAAHGGTVFADDVDDVRFALDRHVRPVQVVLRRTNTVDDVRRAVAAGVTRFVATSATDIDVLSACAHRTAHVYLDAGAPVPRPQRRVDVVGLHCEVDDSDGFVAWGSAAERLLCRMASLRSCGVHPRRLCMVGTPTVWSDDRDVSLIASYVGDTLREGCERWRLTMPAVTLAC